MGETAGENPTLALRSRPWGVSAAKIDTIPPLQRPPIALEANGHRWPRHPERVAQGQAMMS